MAKGAVARATGNRFVVRIIASSVQEKESLARSPVAVAHMIRRADERTMRGKPRSSEGQAAGKGPWSRWGRLGFGETSGRAHRTDTGDTAPHDLGAMQEPPRFGER